MLQLAKNRDDFGVELARALTFDFAHGVGGRPGEFVGANVGEGVEHVGDGDDAAFDGDFLALSAVRITRSVKAFVVGEGDGARDFQERRAALGKQLRADFAVAFHGAEFA